MLRALRSFSSGVVRVHLSAVTISCRVVRGVCRFASSSTRTSARFLFNGVRLADQRVLHRSHQREFSSSPAPLFPKPIPSTTEAFLSPDRAQQLEATPHEKKAAEEALAEIMTIEDHPSLSLIQRLIADKTAWSFVHTEWNKLVDSHAMWEDLVYLYSCRDGIDKIMDELCDEYDLMPSAARAVVRVIATGGIFDPGEVVMVDGPLRPEVADARYVYVDQSTDNKAVLSTIHARKRDTGFPAILLLQGPPFSGKSTRLIQMTRLLNAEYHVVMFEFPSFTVSSSQDLWATISRAIASCNPEIRHTIPSPWTSAFDFLDWISKTNFGERSLVIVCDGFDALYRLPAPLQDEVLLTLRKMRSPHLDKEGDVVPLASRLQALVCVGSSGLMGLVGTDPTFSPFDSQEMLQAQRFSTEQQMDFVHQFERLRHVTVHTDVQKDISKMTAGHPGLFASCYRFMERCILSGHTSRPESLNGWLQIRNVLLDGEEFRNSPTLRRMKEGLLVDSNIAREACKLLPDVLASTDSLPVSSNRIPAVQYLALLGVLRYAEGDVLTSSELVAGVKRFVVSSPLVRVYLTKHLSNITNDPYYLLLSQLTIANDQRCSRSANELKCEGFVSTAR